MTGDKAAFELPYLKTLKDTKIGSQQPVEGKWKGSDPALMQVKE
jgi:hypothetical protein